MKRFYIVLLIALVAVAMMTAYYKSETYRFYGIADTKEIVVNYNLPVQIKQINVVAGQPIQRGDTLVVLDQPELSMKINTISHSLEELKTTRASQSTRSRSEIRQLQAEQIAHVNEIKSQIRKLEAEYELNKKLIAELRSVPRDGLDHSDSTNDMSNPMLIEIAELKKELESARDPSQIMIERLNGELKGSEDPLAIQVERLTKELAMLNDEKEKLIILAPMDGVVGSVTFKEQEKVSPFDTIMTLHGESPSYVKGYIHENVHSSVSVGQTVVIHSLADKFSSAGVVVGVGSRIVEYPIRLRKHQDVVMWGKEVVVRIPDDNRFLLGEKVVISVPYGENSNIFKLFFNKISGGAVHAGTQASELRQSVMSTSTGIEASGVVYLKDLSQYLVVSDETEKKKPILFLYDVKGKLIKDVTVKGLHSINDMESIAEGDDGKLYIASSQSMNKKGVRSDNRKLLIRVNRSGDALVLDGEIDLYDALLSAAGTGNEDWAEFVRQAAKDNSIDIEGMFFRNGSIYLGFKQPLLNNSAVILQVSNIDAAFVNKSINNFSVKLWRKITINDTANGVHCGISDMLLKDNRILILTCAEKDTRPLNNGAVWVFDTLTEQVSILQRFEGQRPEGIAHNMDKHEFFICFDGGNEAPFQFTTLKDAAQ
jgi:multidrug resistance efflux pump